MKLEDGTSVAQEVLNGSFYAEICIHRWAESLGF